MADSIGAVLGGPPLNLPLKDYVSPAAPDILIAGCGTGQQSLQCAGRFAKARILAVDLSLASHAFASRMTGKLGMANIKYAQADIMALGTLDRRFDLIECVGVLHHLADPEAGWRILSGLLRPGGVMKIRLYSEAARQDVVAGRALIAKRGYEPSPGGIRRCRQDIAELARKGNAEMTRLSQRDSFFTTNECRDLLFHVQEHRFDLSRIEAALHALKLNFLGFEFSGPAPRSPAPLAVWRDFETAHPQTFAGMYEFWVQKNHTKER
jgi:SAM-dependent methyltransferase